VTKQNKLLLLLLLFSVYVTGQNTYTISGHVKDASSGEEQIGATIYIEETKSGTVTNSYGFYSITLPQGIYHIKFSFIGFETVEKDIDLTQNIRLDIELEPKQEALDEVVIKGDKEDENVKSSSMGVVKMNVKEIKKIPVLFGEQDVLKTLSLMPGISSSGEGKGGFYVRGGNTDQNLILLDEAPIYNASHLMGFFSVFNSDALKDVKLYKEGIPAKFGGRLSSVVNVHTNNGNSKRFSVSGGLGLISSRLTIEGPIIKDKLSFMVSGRRTYADLFLKMTKKDFRDNTLYFYDLNGKVNYDVGKRDKIFLSAYYGRDKLGTDVFGFSWGNTTATLRWNHIMNSKLFSNTSLIYSNYNYQIKVEEQNVKIQLNSGISDFNVKQDFSWFFNADNTIKFGFNIIYHKFLPGERLTEGVSSVPDIILQKEQGVESALYMSNTQKIGSLLSLEYGFRLSMYNALGPGSVYKYDENGGIIDETTFGKGELIKTYVEPEPRLALTYVLNETSSIKVSYQRMAQNVHLLSSSTSESPTDIWIPSSSIIKPEIGNQVSLGYFKNFKNNTFETYVEVYYKTMSNQIDYKDGANILLNPHIEADLTFGKGKSYGVEFFVKKRLGRFTGWVGYTLSKTVKQFDIINDGKWYSSRQDRTNDFSVVLMYELNKRIDFAATGVYYTGDAVTMPSGRYVINNNIVPLYTERNGYRMPNYYRIDLSMNLKNKKVHKLNSFWNFSIYNVTARKNAYSIYFQENIDNPGELQAIKLYLFSIVPSVTWNFNF
jgi:hypothetical protein